MKRWKIIRKLVNPEYDQNEEINQPISIIISTWTDQQVDEVFCQPFDLSDEACQIQKAIQRFAKEEKLGFVRNGGSTVAQCAEDQCRNGGDYLIYDNPGFTANAIAEFIANKARQKTHYY